MYRVHRLGYIEAKTLELSLSEPVLRRAKYSYPYLTLGFELEIEKVLGVSVEGADRIRIYRNIETDEQRVIIESDRS